MDSQVEAKASLHKAVIDGMSDVVKAILLRGTDPNQRDEDTGRTITHTAARKGDLVMLALLKQYRANMAMVDYRFNTPLSEAVETGNVAVVRWFLDNLPRDGGVVADMFSLAAACGRVGVMSTLESYGATAEAEDELGRTALFHAVENGQSEAARYLLQRGANPEASDCYNRTLLHSAAGSGDLKTLELVFKHCPESIQTMDCSEDTPLHCAASTSRDAVAFLLDRGALVDLRNSDGHTPLDLARKAEKPDIVDLLHEVLYKLDELTKRIRNL